MRLDALFAAPALVLPFLLAPRLRWREPLAVAVGTLPALAFLSFTNHLKFGTWSPLSYGVESGALRLAVYLPLLGAGIAALVVARALVAGGPRLRRPVLALAVVAVGGALAFAPTRSWRTAERAASGVGQLVVDLRPRPRNLVENGLTRSPRGALVYMRSVKKSLLQSCPHFVLAFFALADAARRRDDAARRTAWIAVVPASFLAVFGWLAWHGSVALNLRYLGPILPFAAILVALGWEAVRCRLGPRVTVVAGVVGAAAIGGLAVALARPIAIATQERLFLDAPLVAAALLAALELARRLRWPRLAPAVGALAALCVVWTAGVVAGRDWWTSQQWRRSNLTIGRETAPSVAAGSIVFATYSDQTWHLPAAVPGVVLARPQNDDYATFRALVDRALARQQHVYLLFSPAETTRIETRRLLEGLAVGRLRSWSEADGKVWLTLAEVSPRAARRRHSGAGGVPPGGSSGEQPELDEPPIARRQRVARGLRHRHPGEREVLAGDGLAEGRRGQETDDELRPRIGELGERFADRAQHQLELLGELPAQRLGGALAGVDLAARELPEAAVAFAEGTTAEQDTAVAAQHRGYDELLRIAHPVESTRSTPALARPSAGADRACVARTSVM